MTKRIERNVPSRVQDHNGWIQNKQKMTQRRKLKPSKCLFNFLVDYCNRGSLHGLRYITEPGSHWIERVTWALFFTLSVISAVIVIFRLSARFQAAETSTVVESTNYPVTKLPFPSVTLCPSNRVNWKKALEMEKAIIPAHDLEAVQTYRELVTTLSTITFGDFDRLDFLENRSLEVFYGMNLTNLLRDIAPTCSELLSECWWRNGDKNCCDIFEPQRTEYGFCYSFNSETADYDFATYSKEPRPRRTSSMGDWSGVRFAVKLNMSNQPPKTNKVLGVTTFVGHPNTWPSSGRDSGIGTFASISMQCTSTYATSRILQLSKNKLPCRPDDKTNYNQEYCLTLCRRNYTIKRCGCNPFFLMPSGAGRDCSIEDLICLHKENAIFNNYVVKEDRYFLDNTSGMNCNCPVECEINSYTHQLSHINLRDSMIADTIFIDVHYESSRMIRYRMDIVHTQLDLLVSFGGVIGLFLGGSILSAMELLYHVTVGLINQLFRWSRRVQEPAEDPKRIKNHNGPKHAIPTVYRVLPLLDYYPNPGSRFHKY